MANPSPRLRVFDCLDEQHCFQGTNGKVVNKTVYLCVGLKRNGLKEVLGMWIGKSESSSFWMSVLTDLKARGV